ncbi:MAG TPA: hypothetical protein VFA39_20825 [Steroidobacteraceae bacterium]|nr:hypothetical protein [Steroidobacteraceae bacterium]
MPHSSVASAWCGVARQRIDTWHYLGSVHGDDAVAEQAKLLLDDDLANARISTSTPRVKIELSNRARYSRRARARLT